MAGGKKGTSASCSSRLFIGGLHAAVCAGGDYLSGSVSESLTISVPRSAGDGKPGLKQRMPPLAGVVFRPNDLGAFTQATWALSRRAAASNLLIKRASRWRDDLFSMANCRRISSYAHGFFILRVLAACGWPE